MNLKQGVCMALFIVDIKKAQHTTRENWGNRYIVQADDLSTARDCGFIIVEFEKEIHFDNIDFISLRTSTVTTFDSDFFSDPLSGNGGVLTDGNVMPLFCTLDMKLASSAGGRHGLKFYHTGFGSGTYDGDFTYDDTYLDGALASFVSFQTGLVGAGGSLVSPDGSKTYTTATFVEQVMSHQFTKASKRNPV